MSNDQRRDRSAWLHGPAAPCESKPAPTGQPWRLVLLGAPGVGKGTQAELLSDRLRACHLSTGDVFRAAKQHGANHCSPAMFAALAYMHRGELVPDQTVLAMVRERVDCLRCQGGFLLDGFPRTVAQAEALQDLLDAESIPLDAVLNYELPIEELVARLSGRRTCSACKAVYHVATRPPQRDGVCDQCGGGLIQREDDRADSVRTRMEAYQRSTAPLGDYYRQHGRLVTIPAVGTPEVILEHTMAELQTLTVK